ncbi:endolytic transglycosylase MltG [Bacillus marasmi]|uniref:endolytic transglycosylase MltG n=1 Tax=Bacillus marasmi TaxID=1926279 RepID=UPI0011CB93FA|nr:endolytic transglycosylase MltG [Bacillus marasmi]
MSDRKQDKNVFQQSLIERQSEAKVVRKIVLIAAIIIFLLIGAVFGGGYFYIKSALKPVDPSNKKEVAVEIPIGSSVSGIGQILQENGIIKNAKVFKYYVKFKNEADFMAGEYQLAPSMTLPEILSKLKTGKVLEEVVFKITIPEGKQLRQIAEIIAEKTNREHDEVFNTLNDSEFVKSMMEKYPDLLTNEILSDQVMYPLEGYLFPATYPFYEEAPSLEKIVTEMLNKTRDVVREYEGQMSEKEMSPHKLLTMASLIEEEATEKADRHTIASVFYNRINIDMPLQTDPTVLYAKGKHKDRVLYEDLEVDSPYNTYKNTGLPPGPIACAGTMSIEAALNPEETDFLYFLATAEGNVIFTKSLDEHNREKAKHITGK